MPGEDAAIGDDVVGNERIQIKVDEPGAMAEPLIRNSKYTRGSKGRGRRPRSQRFQSVSFSRMAAIAGSFGTCQRGPLKFQLWLTATILPSLPSRIISRTRCW